MSLVREEMALRVNVERICGTKVGEYSLENIQNNPNFIFENDPSYDGVKLWDSDGNTAFVNSFLECEHYVSGGWVQSPTSSLISETSLQLFLGVFVVALFGVKVFIKFYTRFYNA